MRRTDLVDQPTKAPTRKVKGAATWGLAGVLAIGVLDGLGIAIPGCDASALPITEALTGLVAVVGGYLTRDRA